MELETDTFIDFIYNAYEQDLEQKLWEKWLVELPNMDKTTFIPFEEYKNKHFRQKPKKTDEEIIADAENILKSMSH